MAEAPTLTIRRDWPRPDAAALAPFLDEAAGSVADAQGRRGALHHAIRPVTARHRFLGAALPVWAGARDNLAPYAALAVAKPGDVLVVATDGCEAVAVLGGTIIGLARNAGAVGVVTDGLVRDLPGLEAIGLPVFAAGLSPNSPQKDGPGTIGLPVVIGGVAVGPGDLVLADEDGVVVVPLARLGEVAAALAAIAAKEAASEAAVRSGAAQPGWLAERLARPDVAWLD